MATILVTGANGQLGNELRVLEKSYPSFTFLFTDYEELDITNQDAVLAFFEQHKPQYLINCAAYTAVDKAETDQDKCYAINADAPCILAIQLQNIIANSYIFLPIMFLMAVRIFHILKRCRLNQCRFMVLRKLWAKQMLWLKIKMLSLFVHHGYIHRLEIIL